MVIKTTLSPDDIRDTAIVQQSSKRDKELPIVRRVF